MNAELTIGGLAQTTGVSVETIRYYQRRGLVDVPRKPLGGHRHYAAAVVLRLQFIKRAQQLGFTLDEIAGLLRLESGQDCREIRQLAEHKLAAIEKHIADLTLKHSTLASLIVECTPEQTARSCPLIISLSAIADTNGCKGDACCG